MGAIINYPSSPALYTATAEFPESTTAARSQIPSASTFAVSDLAPECARMAEAARTFWHPLIGSSELIENTKYITDC